MEARFADRDGAGRRERREADPDRVRPLLDRSAGLQSQLDALQAAQCKRIFSEKISTRIKIRPELEKALQLAHDIKEAAAGQGSSSPSTNSSASPATPLS